MLYSAAASPSLSKLTRKRLEVTLHMLPVHPYSSFWTPVKSLGPVVFDVLTSSFLKQSQRKLANEKQIDILEPSICAFSLYCSIFYCLQWASKYCCICFQKCLKFLSLSLNTQCKPLSSLAVAQGKGRLNWPVIKQYPPLNSPAGGFSQCLMKLIDRSSQSCSLWGS